MPYAQDHIGIYKIRNTVTGKCYVGQSQNVKKRIHEHFRLLSKGCHVNRILQNSYNKYGKQAFDWSLEVECKNPKDLDDIENAFLQGNAHFDEPTFFNIADIAKVPMRNKKHTKETKKKISESKVGNKKHVTNEYKNKLKNSRQKIALKDKKYLEVVKFIIDNPNMSYAERGRIVGRDTSTTRKIALKYKHLKGVI
jgi:group I intron endonuclease